MEKDLSSWKEEHLFKEFEIYPVDFKQDIDVVRRQVKDGLGENEIEDRKVNSKLRRQDRQKLVT